MQLFLHILRRGRKEHDGVQSFVRCYLIDYVLHWYNWKLDCHFHTSGSQGIQKENNRSVSC